MKGQKECGKKRTWPVKVPGGLHNQKKTPCVLGQGILVVTGPTLMSHGGGQPGKGDAGTKKKKKKEKNSSSKEREDRVCNQPLGQKRSITGKLGVQGTLVLKRGKGL